MTEPEDKRAIDKTVDVDPSRDSLDAGLAAAFSADEAVVVGEAGHSVLKLLGEQMATVPRLTLRDAQPAGEQPLGEAPKQHRPEDQDSRYRMEREIARGGMGAILKGRDVDLGRDLAVKVLLDAHKDRPEMIERFVEEAQIGGQLQHPGIVPVYELGRFADKRPFFTMKLIKGETLASLLARRANPDDDRPKFLGIFEQICQTMAYAHSRGVIHRDLKPANIMVGSFGEVQVMDWGLAKVLDTVSERDVNPPDSEELVQTRRSGESHEATQFGMQTHVGSVMGTPAYMPPEQACGLVDQVDERADVFGLGAILCEVLTGKPPYNGDDASSVYRQAADGQLEDCFTRLDRSGAEQELIDLAKKTLAADLPGRLRDAKHVATEISSYLTGVQERLKRSELDKAKAQTRRRLSLAIAMLMLLVAIGSGVAAQRFRTLAKSEQAALSATKKQLVVSTVTRLAAQSEAIRTDAPIKSLLLALEAVEYTRRDGLSALPVAHEALLSATLNVGGTPLPHPSGDGVFSGVFTPDSRRLITTARNGALYVWDLTSGNPASSAPQILEGNHKRVDAFAIEVCPDGRWLATGGADQQVELWDLQAKNITAVALAGHSGAIDDVTFSHDGRRLATASRDGTVQLWDLPIDEPEKCAWRLDKHLGPVQTASFSPDDRWLVTGSDDGTARIWDLSTDPTSDSIALTGHTGPVKALFSPDGRWVITASTDKTARLWRFGSDGRHASPTVLKSTSFIDWLAVSPNSRWLATCGSTPHLWDLTAEDSAASVVKLHGHTNNAWDTSFSQSGRWLVTAGQDRTARLWELTDRGPDLDSLVMRGHDDIINFAQISPDDRWLVTGGADGARLWELSADAPSDSPFVLRGHTDSVDSLLVGPNSRLLITSGRDRTSRVWQLDARHPASSALVIPNTGNGFSGMTVLSTDGRRLATSSEDATGRIWDLVGISSPRPVELKGHAASVSAVAMSLDNRRLVTASLDRTAIVWDLTRDPPLRLEELPHPKRILQVVMSPNGRWVLTSTGQLYMNGVFNADTTCWLWDLEHPSPVSRSLDNQSSALSLAFSPDGRYAVTAGGSVRLWDLQDESSIGQHPIVLKAGAVKHLAFTSDGKRLATGGWQAKAHVWDLSGLGITSPNPLVLPGGGDVAFSADGRWLVTSRGEEDPMVWDLTADDPASTGLALRGHEALVKSVRFTPDGKYVITGGTDGTVRLWDLDLDSLVAEARKLAGRSLTETERSAIMLSD